LEKKARAVWRAAVDLIYFGIQNCVSEDDAMFKKVLVPTDFSSYAHRMQECLTSIPGIEEIVLLHVLDAGNPMSLEKMGWSYDTLIDEARTRLAEQADHLAHEVKTDLGVKPLLKIIVEPMSGADGVNLQRIKTRDETALIDGGSVGEAIVRTAGEEAVSLICMGAQGKGLVEGMLLGSVSTEVLRNAECDLLIIRHRALDAEGKQGANDRLCQDIFSKIMLTTDFSKAGEEAAIMAEELNGVHDILLVHVIGDDGEFDEAASRLNLLRERLASKDRRVTVHVLQGQPAKEILTLAKKQDVSLIMMSSQGKSWSRQIRVGSTTFDVSRRAKCPVLVVRSKN
jgi:nucleotide-binding universal stress UspA family protein